MHRIIVSDIFGKTQALEKMAQDLTGHVEIFDPYESENMVFKSEEEAYVCFSSEPGFDAYSKELSQKLSTLNGLIDLIGFSVGASAIWKLSNQRKLTNISGATCFYGSQIRHYCDVTPLFPVQLIFPVSESHFSVPELIVALEKKENVNIHKVASLHGFMNPHSKNYDQRSYNQFMKALCNTPFNRAIHATAFGSM